MGNGWIIAGKFLLWLLALGGAAWFLFRALDRSKEPRKLLVKMGFSAALVGSEIGLIRWLIRHLEGSFADLGPAGLMVLLIVGGGIVLAMLWAPHIGEALASPLTGMLDGGNEPPESKPLYSPALMRRKMGKPQEAIAEVRRQLAKFPDDFEGIMLLAAIQAEDMADLAGAETTLARFCAAPAAPPRQVAAAWTQLADWHLKLASDTYSARTALRQIIDRFPYTDLSAQAEQRIAHLGGTEKILLARHDGEPVPVPAGVPNIGLLDSTAFLQPKETPPGEIAAAYVAHLKLHPRDSEAREKLALVYARDFKRLDLATMEIEELIGQPNRPPKQVIHWLNLLARLQVELGADEPSVRATLERVVTLYPDSPAAELVRSRLARLKLEFQARQNTPTVRLRIYEQNLGLKSGPRKATPE